MECVICKTKTGEPVLLCDSCHRPTHRDCSGLNASELKVMDLKGKRSLRFYCEDCESGIKLIPELIVKIDKLEAELKSIKDFTQNVINATAATDSGASINEKEDLISEIMDRQNRASNVIVLNVNESKKNSQPERNLEDLATIKDIVQKVNINANDIKIFRLGKFTPNKIRPIKVCLKSVDDAKLILKNKQSIGVPNIKIFSDQTKAQRDYFNKVKLELQELINNGVTNKTIKFINNKPTIVNKLNYGNPKNTT